MKTASLARSELSSGVTLIQKLEKNWNKTWVKVTEYLWLEEVLRDLNSSFIPIFEKS